MKTMGRFCMLVALLLPSLSVQAQRSSWLVRAVKAVGAYLDSSTVRGIDRSYIDAPKQPWQVMVRYNANQMNLTMYSHFYEPGVDAELSLEPRLSTHVSHSVGLWLGYRGYGIGYSRSIGRQSGFYFSTGFTGNSYGINLRLRTFRAGETDLHMWGHGLESMNASMGPFDKTMNVQLDDPIRVRTLIINGYYMLNGRRYSYMAAYDQSALQLRSAGSLMVGAMWHNTTLRYATDRNAALIELMRSIGTLKIRQGSLGVGYTYNWVPVSGLLVNGLFMPMLTVYNRQKVDFYDALLTDDDNTDYDMAVYRESASHTSRMALTFDARLSLTYNWNRCFANIYGQWNHFRYSHSKGGQGRVNDWFVNASLGYRF